MVVKSSFKIGQSYSKFNVCSPDQIMVNGKCQNSSETASKKFGSTKAFVSFRCGPGQWYVNGKCRVQSSPTLLKNNKTFTIGRGAVSVNSKGKTTSVWNKIKTKTVK